MNYFKKDEVINPTLIQVGEDYKKYERAFDIVINRWNSRIRDYYRRNMQLNLHPNKKDIDNRNLSIKVRGDSSESYFIYLVESKYKDLDFDKYAKLKKFIAASEEAIGYFDMETKELLSILIRKAKRELQEFDIEQIEKDLFQFLQPANNDVFGAYFMGSGRIEIYIFPIVLFCKIHDYNIQDFVTIILAHEIAHGLHHIGYDKDNHWWEVFKKTEDNVAEGLAQYYTYCFAESQTDIREELLLTFESLTKHQPEAYNHHKSWLEKKYSLEVVYRAMIEARRQDIYRSSEFEEILFRAKQKLK